MIYRKSGPITCTQGGKACQSDFEEYSTSSLLATFWRELEGIWEGRFKFIYKYKNKLEM